MCGLKSPGSRLRPPFFGDVTFFYKVTALPRPAPPRSAPPPTRGAATRSAACAAPPALSLRSAACAALPAPRRLRRDARDATPHAAPPRAAPHLARLRLAPRRLARVRPFLRPAPPCED